MVYLVNLSEKDYLRKKNKWLPKIFEWVQAHGGDPIIPFRWVACWASRGGFQALGCRRTATTQLPHSGGPWGAGPLNSGAARVLAG